MRDAQLIAFLQNALIFSLFTNAIAIGAAWMALLLTKNRTARRIADRVLW